MVVAAVVVGGGADAAVAQVVRVEVDIVVASVAVVAWTDSALAGGVVREEEDPAAVTLTL